MLTPMLQAAAQHMERRGSILAGPRPLLHRCIDEMDASCDLNGIDVPRALLASKGRSPSRDTILASP